MIATAGAVKGPVSEESVRAMFARFNDQADFFSDIEGTWIDRPHYRVVPQNLDLRTRDEVVGWFRSFFDSLPDLRLEVEEVVIAGEEGRERVTVRWRLTGTFTGAPFFGIAASGRSVELWGMDLLSFEDRRLAGNCIYFDQLSFARQVGMLPPEDSRRDRLMTRAFNLTVRGRRACSTEGERPAAFQSQPSPSVRPLR